RCAEAPSAPPTLAWWWPGSPASCRGEIRPRPTPCFVMSPETTIWTLEKSRIPLPARHFRPPRHGFRYTPRTIRGSRLLATDDLDAKAAEHSVSKVQAASVDCCSRCAV